MNYYIFIVYVDTHYKMRFSEISDFIVKHISITWRELPMTKKQQSYWSSDHRKFMIRMEYNKRFMEFPFYSICMDGIPSFQDIILSLLADCICVYQKTFLEFCFECGYDTKSVISTLIYKKCKKLKKKINVVFGEALFKEFMECEIDI